MQHFVVNPWCFRKIKVCHTTIRLFYIYDICSPITSVHYVTLSNIPDHAIAHACWTLFILYGFHMSWTFNCLRTPSLLFFGYIILYRDNQGIICIIESFSKPWFWQHACQSRIKQAVYWLTAWWPRLASVWPKMSLVWGANACNMQFSDGYLIKPLHQARWHSQNKEWLSPSLEFTHPPMQVLP